MILPGVWKLGGSGGELCADRHKLAQAKAPPISFGEFFGIVQMGLAALFFFVDLPFGAIIYSSSSSNSSNSALSRSSSKASATFSYSSSSSIFSSSGSPSAVSL